MTLIELGQYTRARRALEYRSQSVTHVAARGALLAARIDRLLGSSPAAALARAADELALGSDFYIGALLSLERSEMLDAHLALQLCDSVATDADQREYGGIALKARLLAARAALRAGDREGALARWSALQAPLMSLQPADCSPVFEASVGYEILRGCDAPERAAAVLAPALDWLRQAATQVPEAFRDSFMNRNPIHRELLTAATRSNGRVTPRV
jgi:hypothetical protein